MSAQDRERRRVQRGSAFTPGRLVPKEETVDYGATIRQYRMHAGISQGELSRLLGLTGSTVSNWENGISRPDLDSLRALCSYLRIPPARLLALPSPAMPTQEERELLQSYRRLDEEHRRLARALVRTVAEEMVQPEAANVISLEDYIRVKVTELGAAAGAGVPLESGSRTEERYLRRSPEAEKADVVIRVVGDSMMPRYRNGDYLLVRYAQELREGQIGVFVANGEGLVKTYDTDGLHSLNPAYATRHFDEDDDVRLVGTVLGCVGAEAFADAHVLGS